MTKKKKDAESSRPRVASWVLRPKAPPLWLGIVVAAGLIALETILVLALERFTDENAYGALFLLGVLVISANWGFGLAVATTVVSAAVYTSFHMGPDGFNPVKTQDWVAILIFVPIALLANVLVGQARLRAAEADHRPREAEASKEELRVTAEQLAASRARIVTAADDARRRLEADRRTSGDRCRTSFAACPRRRHRWRGPDHGVGPHRTDRPRRGPRRPADDVQS